MGRRPLPVPLRVVGDMDQAGAGLDKGRRRLAQTPCLVEIDLVELPGMGDEAVGNSSSPAGRDRSRSAHQNGQVGLDGDRANLNRAAAADQVQHGKVLGNAQGIVQGTDEGTEANADPSGAGGDGPTEDDGEGLYPSLEPWCSERLMLAKPCLSANSDISRAAANSSSAGVPNSGARRSKWRVERMGALLLSSRAAAKSGCQLVLPVIPDCSAPGSLRGEDRLFPTIAPRRPGCRAGSLWARLRRSQIRSRTASSPLPGWRNR